MENRTIGYIQIVISTVSLIALIYLAVFDNVQPPVEAKSSVAATEAKAKETIHYPTNPRIIGIAAKLYDKGLNLNKSQRYLQRVEEDLRNDGVKQAFLQGITEYSNEQRIAEVVNGRHMLLFGEWKAKFSSANAVLLKRVPKQPYLAVNHEILKFPPCSNTQRPTLTWVKFTRRGEVWQSPPKITENVVKKYWVISFDDIAPLDLRSLNRRVLVLAGCESDANE